MSEEQAVVEATPDAPAVDTGDWQTSLSESSVNLINTKGFGSPDDVYTSYNNLQSLLGADKNELVRIPREGADDEQMQEYYRSLGAPEDVSGYSSVLDPNTGMDNEYTLAIKEVALQNGITPTQLAALAEANNSFMGEATNKMSEEARISNEAKMQSLHMEWGAAFDQNIELADRVIDKFGVSDDMLAKAHEAGIGTDMLRFMAQIGTGLGEDNFVSKDGNGQFGNNLTPAQAKSELEGLGSDPEYVAAFVDPSHPKHKEAVNRKTRLTKFAYPE